MEYNFGTTSHFSYIYKVEYCPSRKYKIKHGIFAFLVLIFIARMVLSIGLILKQPEVWQTYKTYDQFMYIAIELLLNDDINSILAVILLLFFVILCDICVTFTARSYIGEDLFEDFRRATLYADEHSVLRKLGVSGEVKRPLVYNFRFTCPFIDSYEQTYRAFMFSIYADYLTMASTCVLLLSLSIAFSLMVMVFIDLAMANPFLFVDALLAFVFLERGCRLSIFSIFYLASYVDILNAPLSNFNRKLRNFTQNQSIIHFRIEKFRRLFMLYIRKYDLFDRKSIQIFFTGTLVIHVFVSLSFQVGLLLKDYDDIFRYPIIGIVIMEMLILISSAHLLIVLASALYRPIPGIFKLLNRSSHPKSGDGNRKRISNSLFYEIIHTKKSFKFHFFGARISRNSFVCFLFFYSGELMSFIINARRQQLKLER